MERVLEQVVEISTDGTSLHGVYHQSRSEAKQGIVFCDPFAEEKKCAHRVMVETARALAASEFNCLRFDYRGCGDSPGHFDQFGPPQWLEDIAAAAAYMRSHTGLETVGVLGLRLGATMALLAQREQQLFDFAILWEPIVNGHRYLKSNLQRSLIKAMMTDTGGFSAAEVRQNHLQAAVLDFDGYAVSAPTRDWIDTVDLLADPPDFSAPVLILNIGSRDQARGEYQELAGRMTDATARAAILEPFWNRIGLISPQPVVEQTALWLAELQAQHTKHTAGMPSKTTTE